MNTQVFSGSSICLFQTLAASGCASPGRSYSEVMSTAEPVQHGAARIVFLRPRDPDDGSNGGAGRTEANHQSVGVLHYGGFIYVDVTPGTAELTAFGRYRALGSYQIDAEALPGSTRYVEVGPRLSYMIATARGEALGGVTGAAASPDVYVGAGAASVSGTAGMATESAFSWPWSAVPCMGCASPGLD